MKRFIVCKEGSVGGSRDLLSSYVCAACQVAKHSACMAAEQCQCALAGHSFPAGVEVEA